MRTRAGAGAIGASPEAGSGGPEVLDPREDPVSSGSPREWRTIARCHPDGGRREPIWHPILLALASGTALVTARIRIGRTRGAPVGRARRLTAASGAILCVAGMLLVGASPALADEVAIGQLAPGSSPPLTCTDQRDWVQPSVTAGNGYVVPKP